MSTEAEMTVAPFQVAPETYVIPQVLDAPPIGLVYVNSMVITGREPVLVDTGSPSYREQWLEQLEKVGREKRKAIEVYRQSHSYSG